MTEDGRKSRHDRYALQVRVLPETRTRVRFAAAAAGVSIQAALDRLFEHDRDLLVALISGRRPTVHRDIRDLPDDAGGWKRREVDVGKTYTITVKG